MRLIPARGDKMARLVKVQPLFSSGLVWAPMLFEPSGWDHPTWCTTIIEQLSIFPMGAHDDLVDSTSLALRFLRDTGFLLMPREATAGVEDDYRYRRKRQALYDT